MSSESGGIMNGEIDDDKKDMIAKTTLCWKQRLVFSFLFYAGASSV